MALKDLLKRKMTSVGVDEEPVDPIIEQRRKEKFSTPMIYGDELEDSIEKVEKAIKKATPASTTAPITSTTPSTPIKKTSPIRPMRPKYESGYQMSEVISPIYGRKDEDKPSKEKTPVQAKKKVTSKPIEDQIVPIISPIYGAHKLEAEEVKVEVEPTTPKKQKRTGEFQFDFSKMKSEEPSLIDEIDDAMTLDELMSLYEKKFREEEE